MALSLHTWCWYCKQEIPPKSEACPFCSKPLDSSKKVVRCPKCGKYLLSSAERCVQCGLVLREIERPQPPQQPQPPAGGLDASMLKPTRGLASEAAEVPVPDAEAEPAEAPAAEPTAQPEPDAAPSGNDALPPPDPDSPDMQETLRTLEQLEAQERYEAQERSTRKVAWIAVVVAVLAVVALAAVFFFTRPNRAKPGADSPSKPVVCAEGEHEWLPADCIHPKTCAKCGKTEGEALGHHFVDNVCTVCGAYKKPFYFTGADCERDGGIVIFWGDVKNYTGVDVKELQVRLDLFDKDMNQIASETRNVLSEPLAPLETVQWQLRYDDAAIKWKYWRVAAVDYTPVEPLPTSP
ncbi:MAG: zinc ribbon domain-containing protein [Oscillospiraceae bacterium]|nr:zinc ribbon domain-containing protein [Oscillospiraceae bacterium]